MTYEVKINMEEKLSIASAKLLEKAIEHEVKAVKHGVAAKLLRQHIQTLKELNNKLWTEFNDNTPF